MNPDSTSGVSVRGNRDCGTTKREHGIAAVEFAIGAVLLILLAFGAGEYGLTLQKTHTLGSAVRQAARVSAAPCVPSAECKTGNRSFDDYFVLRAAEAGMGDYWNKVEKVIVYKATGPANLRGSGRPPEACLSATAGVSNMAVSPEVICNVYTRATTFTKKQTVPPTTPVQLNLFENLDEFEPATGIDEPYLKAVFGDAADDCATGLSRSFCPTNIVNPAVVGKKNLRTRSLRNPARVGVYVQVGHDYATGLFGRTVDLNQWNVFTLEPHPDDTSTDAVTFIDPLATGSTYDLAIGIDDNNSEMQPGDITEYTITAKNNAKKVVNAPVSIVVPSGMTVSSWTCVDAPAKCTASGSGSSLDRVTLATNETAVFKVKVKAALTYSAANAAVEANIAMPAGYTELNLANNFATDVNAVRKPVIKVGNTNGQTEVEPDGTYTYTVSLENDASGIDAKDLDLSYAMSPEIDQVSWTCSATGGVTCPAASGGATSPVSYSNTTGFPKGGKLTWTIVAKVKATAVGSVVATATASSSRPVDGTGLVAIDNDPVRLPEIQVTIDLVPSTPAVQAGANITYEVKVTNNRNVIARGVKVKTDSLVTLAPVSWSCIGGTCPTPPAATGVAFDTAAFDLPANGTTTFRVIAMVSPSAAGTINNTARVSMTNEDLSQPAYVDNNTDIDSRNVTGMDLQITKTAVPSTGSRIGRGGAITYTLTAKNNSAGSVKNATVIDDVPEQYLDSVTWTCNSPVPADAKCPSPPNGSGDIGHSVDLNTKDAVVTFTVTANVKANAAAGVFSNIAQIKMPGASSVGQFETIAGNNTSSVQHEVSEPVLSATMKAFVVKNGTDFDAATTNAATGADVKYTITITNTGPGDATNINIKDVFPTNKFAGTLSWACLAPAGSCPGPGASAVSMDSTMPLLKEGHVATFTITGKLLSSVAAGAFTNSADITFLGNTITRSATITVALPSFNRSKEVSRSATGPWSASLSNVAPNETLFYRITVTNAGPGNLTNVTITDALASGLTYVSASCPSCTGAVTNSGNTVTALTNLNDGQTVQLIIGAKVTGAPGTINNTASISTPPAQPTTGSLTTPNSPITVINPTFTISKATPVANVTKGGGVTYTIQVTNTGTAPLSGVTVTDTLPAELVGPFSVSCVASGGVCPTSPTASINASRQLVDAVATLPSKNSSVTYTISATVSSSTTSASFTNTATATSSSGASAGPSSATNYITGPDLRVAKTDGLSATSVGATSAYSVVVTNAGPGTVAAGQTFKDTLPTNFSMTSCSKKIGTAAPTACSASGGQVNDTLPALAPNETVTYTIVGKPTASALTTVVQSVTVGTPAGDPNSANNAATDTNTLSVPDLTITKPDGITTIPSGSVNTYTITVKNTGTGPLTDVTVVDDVLPAFLSNASWTCTSTAGACSISTPQSGSINKTFPTVAGGETITFTLKATVVPLSGTISNKATVSANPADSDTTNNASTDSNTAVTGPDLSITSDNGITSINVGERSTYTIVAKNNGIVGVTGAKITTATLSPVLDNQDWACIGISGTASCPGTVGEGMLVNLPANSSITFRRRGDVPLTATGQLKHQVNIALSGVTDPNTANNTSALDTDTIVGPDVRVTSSNAGGAVAGIQTTFDIVVTNSNVIAANGVALSSNVMTPALVGETWTCVSGSGGASCPASGTTMNLPKNSSLTWQRKGAIPITASGNLTHSVKITTPAGFADADTGNNVTPNEVLAIVTPDVGVTMLDLGSQLEANSDDTYTITVTNNSAAGVNLTGVNVTDTLPAVFLNPKWTCSKPAGSSAATSCGTTSGNGNLNLNVNLAGGESVIIKIDGKIHPNATGTMTNTVTVKIPSGITDNNPANNTATDNTKVLSQLVTPSGDGT